MSLPLTDDLGVVQTITNGTPVYWNAGLGYTADGFLCITTEVLTTDVFVGGKRRSLNGSLVVADASPAGRPFFYNAGWPSDKNTGATIRQTGTPADTDPRVAGIAIGPLGGVYMSSAGFSPLELFENGETGFWYDPSDFSTMFQDSAGTIQVTAVGQPVGRILDKSGNLNHASQTTSTARPVLRQDSALAYYLDFDGVDDYIATAAFNMGVSGKVTMFAGTANAKTTGSGTLCEFSPNYMNNVGSFAMLTPSLATSHISFGSRGSLGAGEKETQQPPAGGLEKRVITAAQNFATTGDYGCDYIRFHQIPIGNLIGVGNSDVGAGPLGTFKMNIGAREGGTTNHLHGRVYSLICASNIYDDATLVACEEWIDAKLNPVFAPANTIAPVVAGSGVAGSTLFCSTGTWTGTPIIVYTYHWEKNNSSISGATGSTYTPVEGDAASTITCKVTATNSGGSAVATSNGIVVTTIPANITPPNVTGEGTPGQTLTSGTGFWSGYPTPTYAYQWRADGANISGQTTSTYVVQAGDVGKVIICQVTATNSAGSMVAISNGITITAAPGQVPVNTVAPVITGGTTVGETLTLTSEGTWTGTAPITYTRNWQRDGVSIGSTGTTYVTQAADVGTTITCRVTATNADGATNASSNGIAIQSAATFSPADLFANGEQGVWYDPSDLTTMFQDRAGTTPVTADGQTVGKILDKSGNGNHATAPSDAARPLYKTSGGYSWLQFDGVDDSVAPAVFPVASLAGHSTVCGADVFAGGTDALIVNSDLLVTRVAQQIRKSAAMSAISFNNTGTPFTDSGPSLTVGRHVLRQQTTDSSVESFVDGVGNGPTVLTGALPTSNASFIVGGVGSFFSGSVSQVVNVNRPLTPQEITDTETWVNGKTGAF